MKKLPFERLQKLVYIGALTALNIVMNSIDINLVFAKITFAYIPCFIAGVFMGPLAGGITGAVGDLIGLILHPSGAPMPALTVSCALLGVIPGLIFKIPKGNYVIKTILSFSGIYLICTLGINTPTIYFAFIAAKGTAFWTYFGTRAAAQTSVILVNAFLCALLYKPLQKTVFHKKDWNPPFRRKPNLTEARGTAAETP